MICQHLPHLVIATLHDEHGYVPRGLHWVAMDKLPFYKELAKPNANHTKRLSTDICTPKSHHHALAS